MPNRTKKRKSADAVAYLAEKKGESSERYVPNFSKKRKTCISTSEATGNGLENIPVISYTDPDNDTNRTAVLSSFLELKHEEGGTDQKNISQQWNTNNDKNDFAQQVVGTMNSEDIYKKTERAKKGSKSSRKGGAPQEKFTKPEKKRKLEAPMEVADINSLRENVSNCSVNSSGSLKQIIQDKKDVIQSEKDSNLTSESLSTAGEDIRHSSSPAGKSKPGHHRSGKNKGKIIKSVTTAHLLERFKFIPKEEPTVTMKTEDSEKVELTEVRYPDETMEDISHNGREQHTLVDDKNDFCTTGETGENMKKIREQMSIVANTNQNTSNGVPPEELSGKESHYNYTCFPTSENKPEYLPVSSKEFENSEEISANDIQRTNNVGTMNEGFTEGSEKCQKATENSQMIPKIKDNLQINQHCSNIQETDIGASLEDRESANIQVACDGNKSSLQGKNFGNLESVNLEEDAETRESLSSETSPDGVIISSEIRPPRFQITCSSSLIQEQSSKTMDNIPKDDIFSRGHEEAYYQTAEYYANEPGEQQNRTIIIEPSKVIKSRNEHDSSNYGISDHKGLELGAPEAGDADFSDPHIKHNACCWSSEPCGSPEKYIAKTDHDTDDKILIKNSEIQDTVFDNCQKIIATCDTEDLPGNVKTSEVLHVMSLDAVNGAESCSDNDSTVLTGPYQTDCLSYSIENESNLKSHQFPTTETGTGEQEVSPSNTFSNPERETRNGTENNPSNVIFYDRDKYKMLTSVCTREINSSCLSKDAEEKPLDSECVDKETKNSHSDSLDLSDCQDEDDIPEANNEKAKLNNLCENKSFEQFQQASMELQNVLSQTCLHTNETSEVCTLQDRVEGTGNTVEITDYLKACQRVENKDGDSNELEITVSKSLHFKRSSEEITTFDDTTVECGHDDLKLLTSPDSMSNQIMNLRKNEIDTYSALSSLVSKDIPSSVASSTNSAPEDQVCETRVFTIIEEKVVEDLQEKKTLTQKRNEDLTSSDEASNSDESHTTHLISVTSRDTSNNPAPVLLDDNKGIGIHGDFGDNNNTGQISTDLKNLPKMESDDILYTDTVSGKGAVTDVSTEEIDEMYCNTENVVNGSPPGSSSKLCHDREDSVTRNRVSICNVQCTSSDSERWQTLQCGIIYRPDGESYFSKEKAEKESDFYDDDEELFTESPSSYQTNCGFSVTTDIASGTGNMDKDFDDLKSRTEGNDIDKGAPSKITNYNHVKNTFQWELEDRYPESFSARIFLKDNIVTERKFTDEASENLEEPTNDLKEVTGNVLSGPSSPNVTPKYEIGYKSDDATNDRNFEKDTSPNPDVHDNALKPDSESVYEQFEGEFDDDFELTASQLSRMDADVLKETTAPNDSIGNNARAEEATSCLTETFGNSISLEILNRLRSIDDKITHLQEGIKLLQDEVANIQGTGKDHRPWTEII